MKSRTSYFNATVFQKNLTRFAPAWGLYTAGAMMMLILLITNGEKWMADNLIGLLSALSIITPCYALLCAQLLFGDLYNSRMCNALHALPLKRQTWFFTNVLSGFVFHLIPTVLLSVLAVPILALCGVENAFWASPLFLAGSNLQFACFFGMAVFCALCAGSRFAQAVLYIIINFASIILGWIINTIFVPMYYGIQINTDSFYLFSPIARMLQDAFVDIHRVYETMDRNWEDLIRVTFHPGSSTGYYCIAAAAGIALLFAAARLYRRRKLECAGDFMAIRGLEPVFLVVYSVIAGAVFQFCADNFFGAKHYFLLFLGLAIGWFTGKMLLERSSRVFGKKNILRGALLLGICGATLLVAWLDPLGLESWIPKADTVESVTIAAGPYRYPQNQIALDTREDIDQVIAIQEAVLEDYRSNTRRETAFEQAYEELIEPDPETIGDMNHYCSFSFSYRLKSGRTVRRYYSVWLGDAHGQYLKQVFSTPEAVLGYPEDLPRFLEENSRVSVRDAWGGSEVVIPTRADLTGLYEALLADCRKGDMAQLWTFHYRQDTLYWIYLENGQEITIFSNGENTLNWLRAYGLDVDAIIEKHGK